MQKYPNLTTLLQEVQHLSKFKVYDKKAIDIPKEDFKELVALKNRAKKSPKYIMMLIVSNNKIIKIIEGTISGKKDVLSISKLFPYLHDKTVPIRIILYEFDKVSNKNERTIFKKIFEYQKFKLFWNKFDFLKIYSYGLLIYLSMLPILIGVWSSFIEKALFQYGFSSKNILIDITDIVVFEGTSFLSGLFLFNIITIIMIGMFYIILYVIEVFFEIVSYWTLIIKILLLIMIMILLSESVLKLTFKYPLNFYHYYYKLDKQIFSLKLKKYHPDISKLAFDEYYKRTGFPKILRNKKTKKKYYIVGYHRNIIYLYNVKVAQNKFLDSDDNKTEMCNYIQLTTSKVHTYIVSNPYLKGEYSKVYIDSSKENFFDTKYYEQLELKDMVDVNLTQYCNIYLKL